MKQWPSIRPHARFHRTQHWTTKHTTPITSGVSSNTKAFESHTPPRTSSTLPYNKEKIPSQQGPTQFSSIIEPDMNQNPRHQQFATHELSLIQQILGLSTPKRLEENLSDVVFICIDVEAFEAAQDKITEIGVAVLDSRHVYDATSDLNLPSGDLTKSWIESIRYAHYRPIEHAHLLNRKFVKGCEDRFSFGETTWVKLDDAKKILERLFLDPSQLDQAANFTMDISDQKRNIVFVGHDLRGDKSYLKHIGFSLTDVSNIVKTVDTQSVAGPTKKFPVALQRLLLALGLEPVNLHNAGNDAAYTLQALVMMAVREHEQAGEVFERIMEVPKRLPAIVQRKIVARHVWGGTAVQSDNHSLSTAARPMLNMATGD